MLIANKNSDVGGFEPAGKQLFICRFQESLNCRRVNWVLTCHSGISTALHRQVLDFRNSIRFVKRPKLGQCS